MSKRNSIKSSDTEIATFVNRFSDFLDQHQVIRWRTFFGFAADFHWLPLVADLFSCRPIIRPQN